MAFNLEQTLEAHPAMFKMVLENADEFNLQILLSEVTVDEQCNPCLVRHSFRLDHAYFYPASAIKLCAAVAALKKLDHLAKITGKKIPCTTPLAFHSFEDNSVERVDSSNQFDQKITVAHELRKLFLVSDNEAFNRLYDFVGHRSLNQAMWDIGLRATRLQHHLSIHSYSSGRPNRLCRPIEVDLGDGVFATLPPKKSHLCMPVDDPSLKGLKLGRAHITGTNEKVNEAIDFSCKNRISLWDLQNLLIKIMRKDIEVDGAPLKLDESSRMLLVEAMAQVPGDSCNPQYNRDDLPDDYCKFFLPGLCRVRSKGSFRIYNKIGRAYGYTTENAYIFDMETARSFFLSATVYTNANGVIGDDHYEYETADKLLADLAEVMARTLWKLPCSSTQVSQPLDILPSSQWPQGVIKSNSTNRLSSTSVVFRESQPAMHGYFIDE